MATEISPNSSPEFEFWMAGNAQTSLAQPQNLLSADQLFSHGQILPLLQPNNNSKKPASNNPSLPTSSPNRKWKKIFHSDKPKNTNTNIINASASQYHNHHELNIHIWPFSRSHSSGNNSSTTAAATIARSRSRKSLSAPCSRSNSHGHDTTAAAAPQPASRRWGPLAGGIHVGRSMPVFQLRRKKSSAAAAAADDDVKSTCVNSEQVSDDSSSGVGISNGSCRGEDKDAVTGGDRSEGTGTGGHGSLFNLRSIFAKKVY